MERSFEIYYDADAGIVRLKGWFDAARSEQAKKVLEEVETSAVVDFEGLEFISSGGLGALFATQKRLMGKEMGLKLVNLNPHILEVFQLAGFDTLFEMGGSTDSREGLAAEEDP